MSVPLGMEVHFPTKNIHDNSYCRMFVELYRDKFTPLKPIGSKITYLLSPQSSGDKSKRLIEWGYRSFYPEQLYKDIINNTNFKTIKFSRFNRHGDVMLKAETTLNWNRATTIWYLNPYDYSLSFVTLYTTGKVYDNDKE